MQTEIDATEPDVPVWAVFGDLMAGLLGAFVLILVCALGVQMELASRLEAQVREQQAKAQRWQALEQALAAPLAAGRVTLTDGSTHVKDSTDMAFRTAGRLGLREALKAGAMTLLEPIAEVTVTVPDENIGGVLGDLAARRGRILGSEARTGLTVVTASVPLAEMFGYVTRLRSRTQGRGSFTSRPTGYAPA